MKNSKRKLLLIAIFLAALLSLSAYTSQVPNAHATEKTAPEKSLSILNNVAGFNMTAYAPFLWSDTTRQFLSDNQEEVDFTLISTAGKLRAICSFVGNHLRQIFISDLGGKPSLNIPSFDGLADAKAFLERYQQYTSDAFYGELKSMLDFVNVGKNVTKIEGNVKLEVTVIDQDWVNFMWTYVDKNGIPAESKNVVLSYRHGLLRVFLDNWQLYTIAASPMLSSRQAVSIALDAAKNYSWNVENTENGSVTVSCFKIVEVGNPSLCYLNYMDESSARSGNSFMLYPSWHVPLGFDNLYPGGVSGVNVRVWADTGKVSGISPMVVGDTPSPVGSQSVVQVQAQSVMLSIPIAAIIVISATIAYFINKNRFMRLKGIQKWFLKLCAILLCLIVSFSVVSTMASTVRAIPTDNAKSRIYASTYDQISQEQNAAEDVCQTLENLFSNAGYNTTNHFSNETTRNIILANTENDEDNFDYVTVFHFGHMYGANRYQGNNGGDSGDYVSYTDVAPRTDGKTFFAWIWTCESADNWSSCAGMPSAWANTTANGMNPDGYKYPDMGSNCFIGFSGASPLIGNDTGGCFKNSCVKGKDFITQFYYYALTYGASIRDALDLASLSTFQKTYDKTPLYTGFETWWPINYDEEHPKGWYPGHMRVYGNGNINFLSWCTIGRLEISAWCWNGQWFEMTNVRVWYDDIYLGYTNWNSLHTPPLLPGYHTVEVDDYDDIYSHLPFACFYVDGEFYDYENPTTVYVNGTERDVAAVYG